MDLLERVFSYVCGSTNVWTPGGEALPFCQRCTGLYVGCFFAFLFYTAFRPRSTSRLLWLHGMLLLAMVPFGYHWVPQSGIIRTATGFVFACGLVYYLSIIPAARWCMDKGKGASICAVGLVTVLVFLLLSVNAGRPAVATALSCIGFLGFVICASLVGVSAAAALSTLWRSLREGSQP